jgi:UDP-glucose 6-dehydrogenase
MKQSEAKKVVTAIVQMAQKARSNLIEAFAGYNELTEAEKHILGDLNPYLFPEYSGKSFGVLDMALKMNSIDDLEAGSFYNLLFIFWREPALATMTPFWNNIEVPKADPIRVMGWDSEDADNESE